MHAGLKLGGMCVVRVQKLSKHLMIVNKQHNLMHPCACRNEGTQRRAGTDVLRRFGQGLAPAAREGPVHFV